MKINSISSQQFGAFLMAPPQITIPPVPAIVRNVGMTQIKSAPITYKKSSLRAILDNKNGQSGDMFVLHEAILSDPKVRVVGVNKKAVRNEYPQTKLKGKGRQNFVKNPRRG